MEHWRIIEKFGQRYSVKELAAKYGVSGQTIGNIRNRKTWKHVA